MKIYESRSWNNEKDPDDYTWHDFRIEREVDGKGNLMGIEITKRVEFDMGHRLPGYVGKCKHLHGHRYVLNVTVKGDPQQDGSDEGMVLDFDKMKRAINDIVDKLDHKMMLHRSDPLVSLYYYDENSSLPAKNDIMERDGILVTPFVPTAENIAAMILTSLRTGSYSDVEWTKVQLFETPTSSAEVHA